MILGGAEGRMQACPPTLLGRLLEALNLLALLVVLLGMVGVVLGSVPPLPIRSRSRGAKVLGAGIALLAVALLAVELAAPRLAAACGQVPA